MRHDDDYVSSSHIMMHIRLERCEMLISETLIIIIRTRVTHISRELTRNYIDCTGLSAGSSRRLQRRTSLSVSNTFNEK